MVSQPSPEDVVNFGPTAAMQARVTALLEKNRIDELTVAESKELDEYVGINHLITMLRRVRCPI